MTVRAGGPRWTEHPAPPPLDLVQQFVNSHAYSNRDDAFTSLASARSWLEQHGFDGPVSGRELVRLVAAREAMRSALRSQTGASEANPRSFDQLVAAFPDVRLSWRADKGSIRLVGTGTGTDAVVNALAAAIATAHLNGLWQRLRVCSNDECAVAFWDRTRNHAGRFCSSDVCANRARQRRFRTRAQTT